MSGIPLLLFGATGMLGRRLTDKLNTAGYEVTGIDRDACDFSVVEKRQLEVMVRAVEPVLIINAVDYKAQDAVLAQRINAAVPGWIAEIAQAQDIPTVYFSTNQIFDGTRSTPYDEAHPAQPVNRYGESKYAGEQAVRAAGGYVFRLSWVIDAVGGNFLTHLQPLLCNGAVIHVVADQIGAPTSACQLADAMPHLLPLVQSRALPADVYHLTADGYSSWHGLACAVAQAMGSAARIIPVTSAEYAPSVPAPKNARLDCRKLEAYGIRLPHWRDGFDALFAQASLKKERP